MKPLNINKWKSFENLIELIFKKKDNIKNSFLIINGSLPGLFKKFLFNFISLVPRCKIIYSLKKGCLNNVEEILNSKDSIIMMASYNKKKKSPEIKIKQKHAEMMVKIKLLNLTQNSSKIFFGNFNKNSRPLIFFETIFKERPELNVFRKLVLSFFKSKIVQVDVLPSFDNIISFFYVGSKIFLRIYQICRIKKNQKNKGITNQFCLVETGPRFKAKVKNFKI